MNTKKLFLFLATLTICLFANAQKEIPDSATELLFDKQGAMTRVVETEEEVANKIVYQNPLLDDVPWRRIVLRVVDLREEQNKPLYYPFENIEEDTQKNLFAILFYNFLAGKLTGYKEGEEQTFVPRFIKENEVHPTDTISYPYSRAEYFEDFEADDYYGMINQITQSCVKYYIQEAWYFDKHTSTFHSKILAIAPVFDQKYNSRLVSYEETYRPSSVWFWFPYDKVRPFLQQEYVRMSGKNTKQLLNFDDFFTQRQFYSYIIKDYDLREKDIDMAIQLDDTDPQKVIRIQEQQAKIEAEILDFEQDLWNY